MSRQTPEQAAARQAAAERERQAAFEHTLQRQADMAFEITSAATETGYNPSDKLVEFLSNLLERITR